MKQLKIKALAAIAMAMGIQGMAQATVMSDAILRLSNFQFTDSSGNIINVGTDIGSLVGSNNANADAAIDGISQSNSGSADLGSPLNLAQQCVGGCPAGLGNDDFRTYETIFGAVPPSTEVAFSDTRLAGAAVSGLPGDPPTGADADTRATAALVTGEVGDANSNLGLLVSFDFTALDDTSFGFSTDFDNTARAFVSADESPGSNAQATVFWQISLAETATGTVLSTITPSQINRTVAALNPGENVGSSNVAGAIPFTDLTGGAGLAAGTRYTLNLRHSTASDASRVPVSVPEPATIALLGVGLLGVAASRQRLRKGVSG